MVDTRSPRLAERPQAGAVVRALPWHGDDTALSEALRLRRPGVLGLLFDRYGEDIRRVLRRVLGPDGEIPDLVHEVFLAALESIDRLRDPRALRSWLVGIAVFQARAFIRKRSRRRFLFANEVVDDAVAPNPSSEVSEAMRSTYSVLNQLPEKERVAFALRFIEGMEYHEIAAACAISMSSAKRHVRRGEDKFVKIARRYPELEPWLEEGRWGDT
jgi:RNA polymerase sigma-70 factor (ECF subfamily)